MTLASRRLSLFNKVFGKDEVLENDPENIAKALEKNLFLENRLWWDQQTLKLYLERELVPRGLRLRKLPSIVYSADFQQQWNQTLSKCSFQLMELIIRYEEEKRSAVLKDIEKDKSFLSNNCTKEDYEQILDDIRVKMTKSQKDIAGQKRQKYIRDSQDYESNQVYDWSAKAATPRPILKKSARRGSRRYGGAKTVSFGDDASTPYMTTSGEAEGSSPLEGSHGSKRSRKLKSREERAEEIFGLATRKRHLM